MKSITLMALWAVPLLLASCATMNSKDAKYHLDRGQTLENDGHLEEAVAEYRRAVSADSSLGGAQFALAVSLYELYRQKLAQDAVRQFQRAADLAPQDALAHYGLAVALAEDGLRTEALEQFHAAVQLDPKLKTETFHDALIASGMSYRDPPYPLGDALLRHWDAAPQGSDTPSLSQKEAARKQIEYGQLLGGEGNVEKAADEYHRAVQTDPSYADAFYLLGMVDKDQGKNVEAATLLQRYIQMAISEQRPDQDRLQKAQTALDELNKKNPPAPGQ